jgi:hypothetical protein
LIIGQGVADTNLTQAEASRLRKLYCREILGDEMSCDPFTQEEDASPSDYLLSIVRREIRKAEYSDSPTDLMIHKLANTIDELSPRQLAAIVETLEGLPAESGEDIY